MITRARSLRDGRTNFSVEDFITFGPRTPPLAEKGSKKTVQTSELDPGDSRQHCLSFLGFLDSLKLRPLLRREIIPVLLSNYFRISFIGEFNEGFRINSHLLRTLPTT